MPNHVVRDRIWESKKLERCSDAAAAWYPWMYLVCGDHGIFEYHPRAIWMCVFRRRPTVSMANVEVWLAEYDREGLLIRYHLDGELAFWTGFKGRKPSERKANVYPDPLTFPEVVRRLQELEITEFDGRDVAATLPRRKRGKSATGARQNRASSHHIVSDQITSHHSAAASPAGEVFEHWKLVMNHPDAKLSLGSKREKAVKARLKDGYTVEQLKRAVNGCKASTFHMGENERKEVYDDLELICRTSEKVEQFMAKIRAPPPDLDPTSHLTESQKRAGLG